MNADFCQVGINEPGYNRFFSYHPLLKTRLNQEHDNEIYHPPFLEIIEQLVEHIIHSVTL